MLSRWRREYEQHKEKAFPGNGNPVEAELAKPRKELEDVKMERHILKKSRDHFQQGSEMIYGFINDHSDTYPAVKMAKVLGIRRSRYYRWLQRSKYRFSKQIEERDLVKTIKDI